MSGAFAWALTWLIIAILRSVGNELYVWEALAPALLIVTIPILAGLYIRQPRCQSVIRMAGALIIMFYVGRFMWHMLTK